MISELTYNLLWAGDPHDDPCLPLPFLGLGVLAAKSVCSSTVLYLPYSTTSRRSAGTFWEGLLLKRAEGFIWWSHDASHIERQSYY